MMHRRALNERSGRDWAKAVTHCVHGHEFTPENTLWREEGWRNCRACMRAAVDRYQQRGRA
jgi:hypothetical protein